MAINSEFPQGVRGNGLKLKCTSPLHLLSAKNVLAEGAQHKVLWDGKDNSGKNVASGIYFYHIRAKNFTETKKMVLLK